MSVFKNYIRKCVAEDKNICLKKEHCNSVTLEDVCMIIHIITTTGKHFNLDEEVISSFDKFKICVSNTIYLDNLCYKENVVMLVIIVLRDFIDITSIVIQNSFSGYVYNISNNFVEVAKKCGIYEYPITNLLIMAFRMRYDYSAKEGEKCLDNYIRERDVSAFREQLRVCVIDGEDMLIKKEHLESITLEDVCMVIHLMTTSLPEFIRLCDEVKTMLTENHIFNRDIVSIDKLYNNENLVILITILSRDVNDFKPIMVHAGGSDFCNISNDFVTSAKKFGIYEYPITKRVINTFRMEYEYPTEESEGYFNDYLSGQKKSARVETAAHTV